MRLVVVAITLGAFGRADADPAKAKQLAADAEALVAKDDLVGAAAKYRDAYREDPQPEYICNTGVAYHKKQDLPRAHRYLNQCVTLGSSLDPTYRENLRKVVESVEAKLAGGEFTPVDLALDPAGAIVTIEGGKPSDEPIVGGGRIWVPFGSYRLVAHADGYVDKTVDVPATGHDAVPLQITLAKAPVPKPLAPVVIEVAQPSRPSKLPAIVVSGASVALGVAGALFYQHARSLVDQAEEPQRTVAEFDDLRGRAKDNQHVAWAFGAIAGAGAIVSGYLWYRALRRPSPVEVTGTAGGGAGVSIHFEF